MSSSLVIWRLKWRSFLSKSSSSRSFQKSQLTIEETFQRVASYSEGGIRYETFIKHLLYFICVDNRPFHIVHGKGFQRLMKILAPNIKVPSEDTLKRRLDDLYDVVLQRFVSKFAAFSDNDNGPDNRFFLWMPKKTWKNYEKNGVFIFFLSSKMAEIITIKVRIFGRRVLKTRAGAQWLMTSQDVTWVGSGYLHTHTRFSRQNGWTYFVEIWYEESLRP